MSFSLFSNSANPKRSCAFFIHAGAYWQISYTRRMKSRTEYVRREWVKDLRHPGRQELPADLPRVERVIGDRILTSFPALHGPGDPVSPILVLRILVLAGQRARAHWTDLR